MITDAQIELAIEAYEDGLKNWKIIDVNPWWLVEQVVNHAYTEGTLPADTVAYLKFRSREEAVRFVRRHAMRKALEII